MDNTYLINELYHKHKGKHSKKSYHEDGVCKGALKVRQLRK